MQKNQLIFLIFIFLAINLKGQVVAPDSIRVSLAEWTFDQWFGGGVPPEGQRVDEPVPADRGTLEETAVIGTEQMFAGGHVNRVWSVATTGGYIRCSRDWRDGVGDRYYKISGIHTQGVSSIRLTSSHATSSSRYPYDFKVQYRIGSDGEWKDVFGPFSVTTVSESGISRKQVDNVLLPKECEDVPHLDIRWLMTGFPESASAQVRIDNIFLTASVENPEPDADLTPLVKASELNEADWTIPSWTLFLAAQRKAMLTPITPNLEELSQEMENMNYREMPYTIVASYNGDPRTNMGFAWYTNSGVSGGKVQIVAKANAAEEDFNNPLFTINASTTSLFGVNYVVAANDPTQTAGIPVNAKRNYVSNKALASGLSPGTHYSYRVGKEEAWSSIRRFRTVSDSKERFSFIYVCDTQSNSIDNFDVSSHTLSESYKYTDDPLFVLMSGDLAESQGGNNSEWEYEQFFERMDDVWSELPLIATIGNHDNSRNSNFFHHFNNDVSYNRTAAVRTDMDGTVYSFVVGDVLFMIVNHEDRTKSGFAESLGNWMRTQVAAHPDVRWRIVGVHTGLFSGGSHHNNETIASLRDELLPYYDELNIDISLQGHDHTYSVVGPVDNLKKEVVPGSVTNLGTGPVSTANMTGKTGGVFDVTQGTLYMVNNAASRKKYSPRSQSYMASNAHITGVPDYWSLFTGRFGQSGEPTFSSVDVTRDTIFISTYAIDNQGDTYLFDEIKITKDFTSQSDVEPQIQDESIWVSVNRFEQKVMVGGVEARSIDMFNIKGQLVSQVNNSNYVCSAYLDSGIYIVRVYSQDRIFHTKIIN